MTIYSSLCAVFFLFYRMFLYLFSLDLSRGQYILFLAQFPSSFYRIFLAFSLDLSWGQYILFLAQFSSSFYRGLNFRHCHNLCVASLLYSQAEEFFAFANSEQTGYFSKWNSLHLQMHTLWIYFTKYYIIYEIHGKIETCAFVFVFALVFVIVFLLVRSCLIISLIKCLKGHKVSRITLGGRSLNVFVIVFVIVIVFVFVIVFLLVRSCLLITLIKSVEGHKSLGALFEVVF